VSSGAGTRYRATSRVAAPVAVGALLLNFLWLTGNAWFLLLSGACAGVLVVCVLWRGRVDDLSVELVHPARVSVGRELPGTLTITNRGSRTSTEANVCLHTVGLADLAASIGRLDPGEEVSVPVVRSATSRAVAHGSAIHLHSRPGLGLLVTLRTVQVADHVTVHPRLHDVAEVPVTPHGVAGASASVVRGPGHEVLGVREWRSGEDHRRVHWRSTARTGRLTVLERGDTVAVDLRLVLLGSDRAAGFEDVLSTAASICDGALRSGRPVIAVAWHVSGPILARTTTRWDLLDWWSSVTDTVLPDPAAFGPLALAGFGAGELLVAAPPETDTTWFAAAERAGPGLRLRRLEAAR
jgi:uncharacterized protein (DUF58 family)